jgi:hypothetical protein
VDDFVRKCIENPAMMPESMIMEVIEKWSKRGKTVWTPSRVLKRLGLDHQDHETRPLLMRVQRQLRQMWEEGQLVRRQRQQTSRNTRQEIAYELPKYAKPHSITADEETVTLYRPTGQKELELVGASNFKKWPPRLPEQPIFYPVSNEEYAKEIAIKWNREESKVGYVTKFKVKKEFMDRYKIQKVGGKDHTEWWIPAEDLEELNDNIVGRIEVIGEYRK